MYFTPLSSSLHVCREVGYNSYLCSSVGKVGVFLLPFGFFLKYFFLYLRFSVVEYNKPRYKVFLTFFPAWYSLNFLDLPFDV